MRAVATSVVPSPQVPGSRSAARTISEFPVSEPLLVRDYLFVYCLGLCGAFVRSFSSGSGPPDGGGEPRAWEEGDEKRASGPLTDMLLRGFCLLGFALCLSQAFLLTRGEILGVGQSEHGQ